MTQSLLISREERVLRLTLNRADKRNALTAEMCRTIVEETDRAQADSSIGAILIDSVGDVFCAGMDVDEATSPQVADLTAMHEQLFTMGVRSVKPLVAAVQGPALGGGVGLVANCHVAVAAHGSSFGLTEIRIGMWPFVIYRSVVAAIGERRTLDLSLTGRIFHVPEALQWGLVQEATPAHELDDRATAIATNLAHASPDAVRSGLEFVRRSQGLDALAAAALAIEMRLPVFRSAGFHEGVAAFRERRRPNFVPQRTDG